MNQLRRRSAYVSNQYRPAVYNIAPYLRDCIASLYKQDLSQEDYEIICVDDGSTDESLSILRELAP